MNGRGKPFTRIHPTNPTIPLDGPLPLLFRMGMTGHIQSFPSHTDTHKHAHLTFLSSEPSEVAVCFVDQRQFGRWLVTSQWDATRGPCPLTEYQLFRSHVLASLDSRPLQKPLCELLLDQRYFNGIGNYLRAEICHRAEVNPFASGRNVLARLVGLEDSVEEPDVLRLCHDVPREVFSLGYRYGSMNNEEAVRQQREWEQKAEADAEAEADGDEKAQSVRAIVPPTKLSRKSFSQWLRCYEKHGDGMLSTVDGLGRAMWHSSKWRVAGKTKAGSRRPKKGKTISGADREEDNSTEQPQAVESAEETSSRTKRSKKAKKSTKKKAKTKVARDVQADEADDTQEEEVAVVQRASSRKRTLAPEKKAGSSAPRKRGRTQSSVDNVPIEQPTHTERRRSGRLTALKQQQDEAEDGEQASSTAAEERENENGAAKVTVNQKRTTKAAPTRRAGRGLRRHNR